MTPPGVTVLSVTWLKELPDGQGVQFINFEEHNSPQKERSLTAKSAAERQADYRARKKAEADASRGGDAGSNAARNVTGDVTGDGREEKSRGEKKRRDIGAKAPSSTAKLPTCPTADVIAIYHEVLPDLPKAKLQTKDRVKAIGKVWHWVLTSTKGDGSRRAETPEQALAWFREYFTRALSNDFLMGRGKRGEGHENWKCDLDFLLTDRGMKHVIEKTEVRDESEVTA
jgi:hypothetical protein